MPTYDLSHYSFRTGMIGRVQTITHVHVLPGDVMEMDYASMVRLSPLRRMVTMDAVLDVFSVFVPHRLIYARDWMGTGRRAWDSHIEQGVKSTVFSTHQGVSLGSGENLASYQYLALNSMSGNIAPLWAIRGYNEIRRWYIIHPSRRDDVDPWGADGSGLNKPLTGANARRYGADSNNLPHISTRIMPRSNSFTPMNNVPVDGPPDEFTVDRSVTGTVSGTAAGINIRAIDDIKARYRSEAERYWLGQRYPDILERTWGGKARGADADKPELLGRAKQWLYGSETEGSDDASMGQSQGKASAIGRMGFPPRYFGEHGVVWVLAVVRFPYVNPNEYSRLWNPLAVRDYQFFTGDPTFARQQRPENVSLSDYFTDGDSSGFVGWTPYGQEWRTHPNIVHSDYVDAFGYPFEYHSPVSWRDMTTVQPLEYGHVFQTTQLGHWQANARVNCIVRRRYPDPMSSIFGST